MEIDYFFKKSIPGILCYYFFDSTYHPHKYLANILLQPEYNKKNSKATPEIVSKS